MPLLHHERLIPHKEVFCKEDWLRVAGPERLETVQLAGQLKGQGRRRNGCVDHEFRDQFFLRYRFGGMQIEPAPEFFDILRPDLDPGSRRMTAELFEQLGAGFQGAQQVIFPRTSGTAVGNSVFHGEYDRRAAVALGYPPCREAYDSAVPIFAGDDDEALSAGPVPFEQRKLGDLLLNLLAFAVAAVQDLRKTAGLGKI